MSALLQVSLTWNHSCTSSASEREDHIHSKQVYGFHVNLTSQEARSLEPRSDTHRGANAALWRSAGLAEVLTSQPARCYLKSNAQLQGACQLSEMVPGGQVWARSCQQECLVVVVLFCSETEGVSGDTTPPTSYFITSVVSLDKM